MTQNWDLLIQGAKVFDGSGALPRIQDVAVRDGKIAARGDDLPANAAAEVVDGSRHSTATEHRRHSRICSTPS